MRWTLPPTLLYLGVMGWAIGGVAAVIDSTVMVNSRFHNTLWVPAHFHTYYVMGVVLMILGAVFHVAADLSKLPESRPLTRAIVTTVGVGGYGFLLMFYLAGVAGVPRRYRRLPGRSRARHPVRERVAAVHHSAAAGRTALRLGSGPAMRSRIWHVVRAFRPAIAFVLLLLTLAATSAAQTDPRSAAARTKAVCSTRRFLTSCWRPPAARDPAVVAERRKAAGAWLRLHTLRRRMLAVPAVMARRRSHAIPSSGSFHRLVLSFDPRDSAADMRALAAARRGRERS